MEFETKKMSETITFAEMRDYLVDELYVVVKFRGRMYNSADLRITDGEIVFPGASVVNAKATVTREWDANGLGFTLYVQ